MTVKAMRADARRNLELILDAATLEFGEHGPDAGVAAIASRAGVGTGTIFRRFPSKDDLMVAVFERRAEQFIAEAHEAVAQMEPADAIEWFVTRAVEAQVHDRGFCEMATQLLREGRAYEAHGQLLNELRAVVESAKAAGALREGIFAEDFPVLIQALATTGLVTEHVAPGMWRRYVALFMDALRPGSGARLEPGPPTAEQVAASFSSPSS
ncbi:MAG: TetR/AcrR family transcriptional regulator [Thermoleophilaceae bacterium]